MSIPLPANVSPLGLASLLVTTVLAPATGWLIRNAAKLLKKQTLNESRIRDLRSEFAKLQTDAVKAETVRELRSEVSKLGLAATKVDARVTKVEDAICAIEKSSVRSDQQYETIMGKLEQLSRVTALLETFSVQIAAIVPRTEVDARLGNAEHRIQMVEQDVRKVSQK